MQFEESQKQKEHERQITKLLDGQAKNLKAFLNELEVNRKKEYRIHKEKQANNLKEAQKQLKTEMKNMGKLGKKERQAEFDALQNSK
eukprot:Pgem_evm1s4622